MEPVKRAWIAEFITTFCLIFIGCGSVVVAQEALGGTGVLGVALAHGIALAILVSIVAHISGGHVNPAVTIGLWVTGQVDSIRAGTYIVAQLTGAAVGAFALSAVLPEGLWDPVLLGTPTVNAAIGITTGNAVLIEAILTFFLVFAVFGTAVDPRGSFSKVAGFSIGLVLTIDILAGGPFTGAAMNPARWFGPALITGTWTNWWVWIVGPIAGGVVGGLAYWAAFLRGKPANMVDVEVAAEAN